MSLTLSTTLATACTATDQTVKFTSGTGAVVGMTVKIEQEWTSITAIAADGVTMTLGLRGANGSVAGPHKILAPVEVGLSTEFNVASPPGSSVPIPYSTPGVTFYGATQTLVVPPKDGKIFLKGTGTAFLLPAPTADQDGLELTIMACAATAFTVTVPTATGYKNTTGTATFGGAIGDNMVIVAEQALWNPVSTINVTFA